MMASMVLMAAMVAQYPTAQAPGKLMPVPQAPQAPAKQMPQAIQAAPQEQVYAAPQQSYASPQGFSQSYAPMGCGCPQAVASRHHGCMGKRHARRAQVQCAPVQVCQSVVKIKHKRARRSC